MLHVHRSDRTDSLVSMLAALLAEPLEDPMTPEVVSVPTKGIERWLSQRLSARLGVTPGAHDGVCANIAFPFPGSLVSGALARATGNDPKADPWLPERSVWPLMEVVEDHFDEPWLAPLAVHIRNAGATRDEAVSGTPGPPERFSIVRHVADLFDRYAVHRPDMVQRWAQGVRLPEEAEWQFELWRRVRARIDRPSPAENLESACRRLRREHDLLDHPDRMSLFGLTRLPASYLQVLDAIAGTREVHLFLLHPSPALWDRLEPLVGPETRHLPRREDRTAAEARNPLLASWGRDAHEMQLVLGGAETHGDEPAAAQRAGEPTLLQRVQDDVRADRAPNGAGDADARPLLAAGDDSIRVHSCHGRSRQVEILRDAILHLLEDNPDLEARDIIVMCPDIEHFAPLIQATFGAHDEEGGRVDGTRQLKIRLADRSLRQTNPVMGVLAEVLDLATARMTVSQVLDLAGREPVRRRFRFADDDLVRIEQWVRESNVRWGFDAQHREAFELGRIGSNTWRSGLDRVLLGVAMAEEGQRLFTGTLPLDDVESGDIELAGRLAELVERLHSAFDGLAGDHTMREWAAELAAIADSLTTTSPTEAWQRAELTSLLDKLVEEAWTESGCSPVTIGCADVHSLLTERLKGKATRANFCTGHLTVCTLVPMRSIPHKVVCLLGLDDGSFPRHLERDGDDLTAQDPRVGDRDARSEDRQLLLDALLAAREHLVITYSGHDERSNQPRPPAVPVGELFDVVDHMVRTPSGRARDAIVVQHPLQPFDPRNFVPGELIPSRPWSFDELNLDGARAARDQDQSLQRSLARPLESDVRSVDVDLDVLDRFLRDPVKVFLRERLGVSLWDRTREYEDAIPIVADALTQWGIAERILGARLAGASWDGCEQAEIARGALPPAALAYPVLDDMRHDIEELVVAAGDLPGTAPESFEVEVHLPGLPTVVGTVAGVRGSVIPAVTYRRMQPALRLSAWLRLLALSATYPEVPFEAQTIGRASKGSRRPVSVATVGPLDADPQTRRDVARAHLADLVELYQRGVCEPLPIFCKTSAAYALDRALGKEPGEAAEGARREWESRNDRDNENRDKEHVFVLGEELSFPEMLRLTGFPSAEEGVDLDPPEPYRFGVYARLVWDGLLDRRKGPAPVTALSAQGNGDENDEKDEKDEKDEEMPSFLVHGPLPRGTALLEASAGTGKTFTIAALTTRYVAEDDLPIDRLLVMTFTRMATGELREKVRDRLVRAFDGLADVLAGREPPAGDDIVRLLADVPRAEQELRCGRLGKAIASFDAATIETTHGFCLQVLYGLGTAGDVDRDVTLVEDVRDLVDEVVDDLYLRKFAHRENTIGFSRQEAGKVARKVLDIADAFVVPPLSDGDELEPTRRRFAERVRREMEARKRALNILTYDDVLLRLRDTLADPARGALARDRLRQRFDVVLVDEFQDTDPVQWDIMRGAFDADGKTLVLIGDPKQAIYAFRGADVHTYLKAKATVQSTWTLDVNWRSDKGLLDAYDALFEGAQLGQAGITYRHVRAAPRNIEPRLAGASVAAPLHVRVVHTADRLVPVYQQKVKAPEARDLISKDLAAQTVELLEAGPEITTRHHDRTECRPLHAGDIAVLVRSNRQATTVCDALLRAHVPTVISGAGSVFASGPATEWLRFLEALEQPASSDRASMAAMTQFIGWSAEQVADKDDVERWEHLHGWLHTWGRLFRDKGVATLYESVTSAGDVPARVLRRPTGERFMTDLRHLTQLLHDAAVTEGASPTALANWLGRRILEADRDGENEDGTRRLESDAHAVQVITVHRSKGLEFPVVLIPYAWDGWAFPIDVPVFHDPDNGNERTVDVGCPGPALSEHRKLQEAEEQGESLRLLYVALTRARHQAVLWWAGAKDTKNSSLSRLLFDRDADGQISASGKKAQSDAAVVSAFAELGPEVSVEQVARPLDVRWQRRDEHSSELGVTVFDRHLDTDWRRASYSSITNAVHEQPAIASEPEGEAELTLDEETPGAPRRAYAGGDSEDGEHGEQEANSRTVPLGLAAMPGGTLVGTVIHGVLERVAFDAEDLDAEVETALRQELAYYNVDLGDHGDVVRGLCASIESSLGPAAAGRRLRDVARVDRLDELGFELPLVGGDATAGRDGDGDLRVADLASVLMEHLDPGDPMYAYAGRLRDPAFGDDPLRGFLTGSLDLVLRLPDGRFMVADYKTNRLAVSDETLTAWHYRPAALEAEMAEAHYPLQALLYSVALHRYLRWRQPGYDPARHLGGALYLFVRGMSAEEPTSFGETPCGVWSWCPPAGLITALSDLFDRGVRR